MVVFSISAFATYTTPESLTKTYIIRASHSKKFSSFVGPAMMPSGGFSVNSEMKSVL